MNRFSPYLTIFFMLVYCTSNAEQVTININASVMQRSCIISGNSINANVELQAGDFRSSKKGLPFAGRSFKITLEECPDNISNAYIKFSGESDDNMMNLLKNVISTEDAATGVALGLYDTNNKNIDITNNKITLLINHSLLVNSFEFYAYYVRTSDIYTAGKVMSIANFELTYD